MRYAIPECWKCGEALLGECDLVPGVALVQKQDDGTFEYTGDTEMFWDGQVNERDLDATKAPGEKLVQCRSGHMWLTKLED